MNTPHTLALRPLMFLAAALFLAPAARPSSEELQKIAADRLAAGWSAVDESTVYGYGDGLQGIYNGGYEVYTRAGIVEALRRMYQSGLEYVEVTVHTVKSPAAARAFLADRYRMETGKNAPHNATWDRFTATGAGSTTAYGIRGTLFVTIVAYDEGVKGARQTEALLKSMLAARAGK